MEQKTKIEILIERGMENNQNIVNKGQAEQLHDRLSDDLIMTIKDKKHDFFIKREGK